MITLIIGSTGNKGESRRADFGHVINQHPQLNVILTADDPNFEDPQVISEEIASHVSRPISIISDRELAIKEGLKCCKNATDALIIAGKGADAYQIVNGTKTDYLGDLAVAKQHM